jgi:hypothetical protein
MSSVLASAFFGANSTDVNIRDAEIMLINERLEFYRNKLDLLKEVKANTESDLEELGFQSAYMSNQFNDK